MVASARVFVDTNVLLRFHFPELDRHIGCEAYLQRLLREGVALWISDQVIREFYVQATHANTFAQLKSTEHVLQTITTMPERFTIAESTPAARAELMLMLQQYEVRGVLTHDVNILATMLANGLDTICTLDSDFARFQDRVTITRPQADPA